MLTKDQLDARAQLLWGHDGVVLVTRRPDQGVDVKTERGHLKYHRLDLDGHVACHRGCRELEAFHDGTGARARWEGK
jgi:hypothetical protein